MPCTYQRAAKGPCMRKIHPTIGQDSLNHILKVVVCRVSHNLFRKPTAQRYLLGMWYLKDLKINIYCNIKIDTLQLTVW